MKKLLLLFVCSIWLVGCAEATDKKDFNEAVDSMEAILDKEDWPQIQKHAEAISDIYNNSKWKLQLLGDEDEYESLQEAVNDLKLAARQEDKSECEKELTTIRTYLKQIYSL